MDTKLDFLRYWTAQEQIHGAKLLYSTEENVFYILIERLDPTNVLVAPLHSPTEKWQIDSESLVTKDEYTLENNQAHSEKNKTVFSAKSEANQSKIRAFSENGNTKSEAGKIQLENTSTENEIRLRAILDQIRERSEKVQNKTGEKNTRSTKLAQAYERKAVLLYQQGDKQALKDVLGKVTALNGKIDRARVAGNRRRKKGARRKFWAKVGQVAIGLGAFVLCLGLSYGGFVAYKVVKKVQEEAAPLSNAEPKGINKEQALQLIQTYQESSGLQIGEARRKLIVGILTQGDPRKPYQVIDSVLTLEWKQISKDI